MTVVQTICSRNCSSLATVVKESPTTMKRNSAQASVSYTKVFLLLMTALSSITVFTQVHH